MPIYGTYHHMFLKYLLIIYRLLYTILPVILYWHMVNQHARIYKVFLKRQPSLSLLVKSGENVWKTIEHVRSISRNIHWIFVDMIMMRPIYCSLMGQDQKLVCQIYDSWPCSALIIGLVWLYTTNGADRSLNYSDVHDLSFVVQDITDIDIINSPV